jgi:rhamnose transport system ATP-binding protein
MRYQAHMDDAITSPRRGHAAAPGGDPPLLSLRGIVKRYAGVQALRGVDFDLAAGEVHALVGENGAGKSTLIKIVSGAEQADAGSITLDGKRTRFNSTAAALQAGIGTVFQEPHVFADLTVAENVFVGREIRTRDGRVDWERQRRRCLELLEQLHLDPGIADRTMEHLPVATWQLVSIAKALAADARVLIFDEPSAILTARETETLFGVIRRLRERGVGIIYISHRLDELWLVTDRVTVLRDGQLVTTAATADLSPAKVAQLMVGRELTEQDRNAGERGAEPALRTRGLGLAGKFSGVDLEVREGEVVALYGLIGCGADDVALALYGIEPATEGEVLVAGKASRIRDTADADSQGIALLPADRKRQGMFGLHSVAFNMAAGNLGRLRRAFAFVDRPAERRAASGMVRRLNVRTPSIHQRVSLLSGGNQQKVMLARQLLAKPKVLVLEEPTQGVDVGAKEEIHRIIWDLAASGVGVLAVSSDLPEVLRVADRIVVMREGRVVAEFPKGVPDVDVLAAAAGRLRQQPDGQAGGPTASGPTHAGHTAYGRTGEGRGGAARGAASGTDAGTEAGTEARDGD